MIVVADTSPINYLILLGHIEILPYFYDRVLVPPAVWEELCDSSAPESVRSWMTLASSWIERRALKSPPESALNFLDTGEREAISLAEELGADRMIVDETLAREEAQRRKLSVIGTLGVLRNAARANLLSLPETLDALQRTNFYVGPELIRSLLEEEAVRRKLSGQ